MLRDQDFFSLPQHKMRTYIEQKTNRKLSSIDSAQISVVVQGPVFHQEHPLAPLGITHQVLKTIREQLPQSKIIFATWKDQKTSGLQADNILLLDDPGTTNFYRVNAKAKNLFNNGNRLIYSTQQALALVTTPYTLKLRSDLLLFHPFFSSYTENFDYFDSSWQIFKQRIMGFPIYSLKFEQGVKFGKNIKQPRPFHISDWAYFGRTEDIKELFNCPLMDEPQTSRWFEHRAKPDNDLWENRLWRYSPEQYLISNLAYRHFHIELEHSSQDTPEILDASERLIANNFVILDQFQWGLYSLKLQNYQDSLERDIRAGLYSHQIWYQDYQRYCVEKNNA